MKKLIWVGLGAIALIGSYAVFVQAQAPTAGIPGCTYNSSAPTLSNLQSVGIQCDTNGQLKISGSINATSAATATAANPSYVEGTSNPISQDLSGHLRTLATSSATATAAAPSYMEATDNAFSQTLAGALRTDLTTIGTTAIATGSGVMTAGTQRMAIATDSPGVITTGTAGSASAQVLTVQGVASMTPVQVSQATAANLNATVTGSGSAGSAATGVVTIQGIAAMTKLLVTPDSVALPANQSVNVAQLNGQTDLNGGVNGSQSVGGTVATNVAITANPINLGAQAVSSENTAVTTARQVQLIADLVGKLIVLPYANPENFVMGTTAAMTGTTTTSIIAAPAAGLRNYVTNITCTNSHATVGTFVLVQDGSGGTTFYEAYAAAVGGGFSITLPVPLRQPTTATAVFVADVTTGANVICSASGYKGA